MNILKHSENTSAILNAIQDIRKHILSSICRRSMHSKDAKADSFHNSFQVLLDALVDEAITKRLVAYSLINELKNTSHAESMLKLCDGYKIGINLPLVLERL